MQTVTEFSAPRVSSFGRDARLTLSGPVLADDVEKQLDRFYARGTPERPLLLDMESATFVEVAALLNCIATIVDRTERHFPTYIACPADQRVRDFMKVWRFPDALEKATGLTMTDFLVTEHQTYLTEPQVSFTGQGDAVSKLEFDPDWETRKPTPRNFFEFTSFTEGPGTRIVPEGRFARAPREEGKKWTRPLIQQVLEKHLPGGTTKDEVARVVIYEALSNAVRHPSARTILVVSKLERPGERPGSSQGTLRICVWDDGESIAGTLMQALVEERTIHAFHLPPYMCDKVFVSRRNFTQTRSENHIIDQSERITKQIATEQRLLLASLFPGVTRTFAANVPRVPPFEDQTPQEQSIAKIEDILSTAPGMGLYSLTRTVLDQFTGTLFIRSGHCRLLIEPAHDQYRVAHGCRYKCKITDYEKHMPPFRGNLLAMQLPLRN